MPLDSWERLGLLKALEERGWFWRNEFIYARNETMWLLGSDPWHGDLSDFRESMVSRMDKVIQNQECHDDKDKHMKIVEDVASLVEAIQELLNRPKTNS